MCRTVAVVGDTVRENDEKFTAEVSAVDDRDMVSDPAVFQVTLKDGEQTEDMGAWRGKEGRGGE